MIPVYEPFLGKEEERYVADAVSKGEISGNFGTYLERFEEGFAQYCGVKHGIAVTSGTTALHLAVDALGIGVGDEVLVSASTNIATALGVVHNGAVPVPVDSESETWNLDLSLIESLITPRSRAIIPVHLFGHPVDMDALMKIAKRNNLKVIEDCAESHGATVRGRMTGSFGDMACFSFYANKVITTGEGGMVITDDDALAERLRLLRNLAFTVPRFRHDVAGYNFRMAGYQAAMGLAQLEKINVIIEQKRRVAHRYNRHLENVSGLNLPVELEWAKNVYWVYAVTLNTEMVAMTRDEVCAELRTRGVETRTFFCPMNQQPCLQRVKGYVQTNCPVADLIWETGFYLPSAPNLENHTIDFICDQVKDILG